ncbi:MAG: V-type ATPase 116kDa subunit family protein [Bacteroidales bacterium]
MKKYSFIVFHQDYQEFLNKLGKLGVLHVIEREHVNKDEELKEERRYLRRLNRVIDILDRGEVPATVKQEEVVPDPELVEKQVEEIESVIREIKALKNEQEELRKEQEQLLPWGEFDTQDLDKLKDAGYHVKFYRCLTSQFDPVWEEACHLFLINKHEGKHYFLILQKEGEETEINAEEIEPGNRSLSELKAAIDSLGAQIDKAESKLEEFRISSAPSLKSFRVYLEDKISFKEVYINTSQDSGEQLMVLEGWVPKEADERVNRMLEAEEIVSFVNPPVEGEMPPVELKNSKFSALFEPISKLFDLPSYGELDLTPYFAPFFMLFFGFCLGDAGYGVFFILFAGLLKLKIKKKELRSFLSLAQYFGIATILFGLISGTFFGINLIDSGYTISESSIELYSSAGIPDPVVAELQTLEGEYFKTREAFVKAVEGSIGEESLEIHQGSIIRNAEAGIPLVRSFRHIMQNPLQMFYLSILLGGIQILFGIFVKIMNITRRKGFKYAFPSIGWLLLIISLILNALGLFEGAYMSYVYYGLMIIAAVMILILNRPGVNVFVRLGSGLWDSYGMITGFFGDLLSYIRLFALGISSAILGFVFNDISLQLLNIPYVGWLFFLLLLLVGHTINLFMATLGGFIHPMRLTFVEFYKNAGFEGGGKKYNPFIINN